MYYKVYKKYVFPSVPNGYWPTYEGRPGEIMMFYCPNLRRALLTRDMLIEAGHKDVFIREFTIEEQAEWIIKQYDLKGKGITIDKVKFYLENSNNDL